MFYNKPNTEKENEIIDTITFDYLTVYLFENNEVYIVPITKERISTLDKGDNLKERLTKLYNDASYYDLYINDYKLKGYKLGDNITKISKIIKDEEDYLVLIKDDNRIDLFSYNNYYNLMNINVQENYNDYENVLDINDNYIIYLDGSKELIK